MINIISFIIGCVFLFLAVLSVIVRAGTLQGILLSALFGVFCILFSKIFKPFPKLKIVVFILIIIYVISFLIISLIIYNYPQSPPYSEVRNSTVVVLGAKIKGYSPSPMLAWRLDKAYEYLINNSDQKCIVSGGQGIDEPTSEASVMKDYLVKKGISPERIFIEPKATNTKENLIFSNEIIKENSLPSKMLIVTTDFHCLRSSIIAKRQGITHETAGAVLPLRFRYPNYVREYFAVIKSFLLDR